MTTVTNASDDIHGTPGVSGTSNPTTSGTDGGDGTPGARTLDYGVEFGTFVPPALPDDEFRLIWDGGNGGTGGIGGDNFTNGPAGHGGNGGAGASAYARLTNLDYSGPLVGFVGNYFHISSSAHGGAGGTGHRGGAGNPNGVSGLGGYGGSAEAILDDVNLNVTGTAVVSLQVGASGGAGSGSFVFGYTGGDGADGGDAIATFTSNTVITSTAGDNLLLQVAASGGAGGEGVGSGYSGGDGGDAHAYFIDNLVQTGGGNDRLDIIVGVGIGAAGQAATPANVGQAGTFSATLTGNNINLGEGDDTFRLFVTRVGVQSLSVPLATTLSGNTFDGGAGNDLLYLNSGTDDPIVFNLTLNTVLGFERIIGGNGDDSITGDGSANYFDGHSGNDTLRGGGGNDYLDGNTGADSMFGAAGDDTFVVDSTGDVVTESLNKGTDTIRSSIAYTLKANFENLVLNDIADINGTGNALNNVITGNSGANVLKGLGGADTLDGAGGSDTATYAGSAAVNVSLATGLGSGGYAQGDQLVNVENLTGTTNNDTLEGNAGANVLVGGIGLDTASYQHAAAGVTVDLAITSAQNTIGAGTDTVSGFENLTGSAFDDFLSGNASANVIKGLDGNDQLMGRSGADTLNGGTGNDTLTGGAGLDTLTGDVGADTFVFGPAVAASADKITGFEHGIDLLQFSAADYGLPPGPLDPANLVFGAGATDPHAEFIYNAGTRTLLWDPNGVGGAAPIKIATFNAAITLTASDFVIV